VGVPDAQAEQHTVVAAFIEAFGAGEQQLADPIQRIGFAATMPERLVLHSATNLVETTVPDAHHVKRIRDASRVIQMR
jgi:hypothetical protein